MTTFFKKVDNNQKIIHLISYDNISPTFTHANIIQISEEEYNKHILKFQEKASLTDKLYKQEIKISDVPIEWQEEVQMEVNRIISEIGPFVEQDITGDEFLEMVEEVI